MSKRVSNRKGRARVTMARSRVRYGWRSRLSSAIAANREPDSTPEERVSWWQQVRNLVRTRLTNWSK